MTRSSKGKGKRKRSASTAGGARRDRDRANHMVTLWCEDRDDPWVIDPTGAMTTGMPRMSELPNWVPLKVFGETAVYTVKRGAARPAAGLAANH